MLSAELLPEGIANCQRVAIREGLLKVSWGFHTLIATLASLNCDELAHCTGRGR